MFFLNYLKKISLPSWPKRGIGAMLSFCIYLYYVTYLHMRLISYKIGCQGEAQGQLNWGLPTTKPYCDAMHHP